MLRHLIFAAALAVSIPAAAQSCATVTVSTATAADIPALKADAACFAKAEAVAATDKTAADKRRVSARASRQYREARIAQLGAIPAPPPPALPAEPAGDVLASSIPVIPSNFDASRWLVTQGTLPPDNGADPVGAFRLICSGGPLASVDPMVEPGKKPSMHAHEFWGNDTVTENSDYTSLRAAGSSKCQGGDLYRTSAWGPSLVTAEGQTVRMDYASIYYKRVPAGHPDCTTQAKACADFPAGLRLIVGRNYAVNGPPSDKVSFGCLATGKSGTDWVTAATGCTGQISAAIAAPDCWDGVRAASADHQSHMAYRQRDRSGKLYCPSTHPLLIPTTIVTRFWTIAPGERAETWKFSSDWAMGTPAGVSYHFNIMEAQDPAMRDAWHRFCIDKHLNCSGGQVGDGRKFVAPAGFGYVAAPRLVVVP